LAAWIGIVLACASTAHADPPAAAVPSGAPSQAVGPPPLPPGPSPDVANALSVAPTLAGFGLAVTGLIWANREPTCTGDPGTPVGVTCVDHFDVGLGLTIAGGVLLAGGPSLGHIYAGHPWSTGLKVRLAGVGIGGLGVLGIIVAPSDCGKIVCAGQGIGLLVVIGGAATFAVGAGIDAATAADAARADQPQFSLAALRTPSGTAPALVLSTTF